MKTKLTDPGGRTRNETDTIAKSGKIPGQRLSDYPEGNTDSGATDSDDNHPEPKSFGETTNPSKLSDI